MATFLTVIHAISCVFLVLAVLVQSGKGAEMSASFAGSSQSVLGSSGGANFITRFTAITAAIFMLTSLFLTILTSRQQSSLMEGVKLPAGATAPVTPAPPPSGQAPAKN